VTNVIHLSAEVQKLREPYFYTYCLRTVYLTLICLNAKITYLQKAANTVQELAATQ